MRANRLVALLWCALCACSAPFEARAPAGDLVLQNRTARALLYLALERESSNLVDPAPRWVVADHLPRLVEPGESRAVEVDAYSPGDDVRLFLYRVEPGSPEAPLAEILTVTHEQLRRAGYRVIVDQL